MVAYIQQQPTKGHNITATKGVAKPQVFNSSKRCINSLVNLHIKNPTALTTKDMIVKVSTLIHGTRCDKPSGNHSG